MARQFLRNVTCGAVLLIGAWLHAPTALAQSDGMMGRHMMGGMSGYGMMNGSMMGSGCPVSGSGGMPMMGMGGMSMMHGGMMGMGGMGMMNGGMMGMGGMGMMHGPMMGMSDGYGMGMYGALGLSDKQRESIQKTNEQMWKKQWELMTQLHEKQAALRGMSVKSNTDVKTLMKSYREISDLRLQMMENRLTAQQQSSAQLNKDQQEKWQQMQQWMMSGWY